MNPSSYNADVLRTQMAILRQAAKDRAALEESIPAHYEQTVQTLRTEQETSTANTEKQLREKTQALKQKYEKILSSIESTASSDRAKLEDQRNQLTAKVGRQAQTQEEKLREDFEFDDNAAKEIHKEQRQKPKKAFKVAEKEIKKITDAINECEKHTVTFVSKRGVSSHDDTAGSPTSQQNNDFPSTDECLKVLQSSAQSVIEKAKAICSLPEANRLFSGNTVAVLVAVPIILGIFITAGAAFGSASAKLQTSWIIAVTAITFVLVVGGGIGGGMWWLTKRRRIVTETLQKDFADLCINVEYVRRCLEHSSQYIKQRLESQTQLAEQQIKDDIHKRNTTLEKQLQSLSKQRQKAVADLEAKASDRTKAITNKRSRAKEEADSKYPHVLSDLETQLASQIKRISEETDEKLAAAKQQRDSDTEKMVNAWKDARTKTASIYSEATAIDTSCFLSWNDLVQADSALPKEAPPGLRFGHLALSLSKVPGGISSDPALNTFGPTDWTQPAMVSFPSHASLLVKTVADQQEIASAMLQALTLRIATGIPPGQSRFTIIDPLGLGKQFAGFMHLADHDELLVTSRIWTEPQQIDERLSDLTEQMEVVIQKYLRNEYESIGDYNAEAEVPEPYRFVVVANFPANFTETSARRLMSIAASGARCGVYVIVSIDTKQIMPSGFSLEAFEKLTTTLVLKDGQFTWNDDEFSQWPLSVEEAPPDAIFTDIIQRVGKEAKAAKRVEVPFDRVAPPEDEWWEGSTATEVLAPLGPAGAKKLQFLKLGKGTSQHALIAGKTGSGKSTLMHAMITSLALQYSPNEIQFYLIDFKKGVEFKLYDHYALPHARVIAIESEREFGLSVLEQLDKELKRRGDLFRELSVQNVDGFRKTDHPDPMPRILLVIDEFQEIFVEDDKIAQDASLILDRLVRQGRAFGMHVLLGSQTLGGSYSLPRATIGQMAIRIALQCNEADSSLILSEDNTSARLLTRPGEAIYNDANGMVEGNNHFQVVFLTDERRELYLGSLRELADRRTDIPTVPRIVFDGNEAANPSGNALLSELLASGTVHGKELVAPLAWIGDAIAIKDPTAAIFRRQGGANLLIVGQREDLGTSLLAMSMVSLGVGHDPYPGGSVGKPARFVLLEPAIAEEKPEILLSKLSEFLPHEIDVAGRLGVADAMADLAAEVQRRIDEQILDGEAIFLIIRDLGRFRELRKEDGGFGFSIGDEKKSSPADHFATILRDGPPVGIHAIIWCDSLTNLMRTFDRSLIKEFELRTVFQMSGTDSSQLIDSPLASKLGPQRAMFIHEETGTLEKFRPYAFPSNDWLATVSKQLKSRAPGTREERPSSKQQNSPPAPSSDSDGQSDSDADSPGLSGGGFGDFNFTKMLDDLPGDTTPNDEEEESS